MISNASVINTGNGIVDQIGTMGIVGHMTPDNWFNWILREYGKPNLLAMREYGYPVLDCKIYEDMTEEQTLSVISQDIVKAKKDLNITNAKIAEGKTVIEKQKGESKELGVRILSKKQVLELPDPPKTLDGKHYKVPVTEYNNVKATAGQVNEIKKDYEKRKAAVDKREKSLVDRSAALDQRAHEIERSRKLPIKEKMELAVLRVLKSSIKWLSNQDFVPLKVRSLLQRALNGEDLSKTQGIEQPGKIRKIAR